MEKDVIGLIIDFCIKDEHFKWLTLCKKWNRIGTKLKSFESMHTIYDLSVFFKTLTMTPVPKYSASFKIEIDGYKFSISYYWANKTDEDCWFCEYVLDGTAVVPDDDSELCNFLQCGTTGKIPALFNGKKCKSIFKELLKTRKGITVQISRWGTYNNFLSQYRLIDDLIYKRFIHLNQGKECEKYVMNTDNILEHYLKNKEMYPQFVKEYHKVIENEKNRKNTNCTIL